MHHVTAFVSHEDCSRHDTGWSHPDHQGRLPAIVRAVQRDMVALWEPLRQTEAVPATEEDLRLVHTPAYIERVRETARDGARAERTLELDGVPVSGASWDAALAGAGAALTAVEAVLGGEARNGFALARPPGRGAGADAAGECSLFNNVAIAARHLRARRGAGRVLVVAWGARQPAALARVLQEDHGIRLISIHQHPQSFPDPEATADHPPIDSVALAPGSGGDAFAAALREALEGVPADESPDFVLLSAGFDVLAADAHGSLAVEPDEVHAITLVLREWTDARAAGRLVSVLEGGYAAPQTARAVIQHLRALAGLPAA
ncbi:MAG: histone deacetylase [Gemmatimonadetes bacterium]|nr:histone deacetylase [Gemmatimonadota bacterium]